MSFLNKLLWNAEIQTNSDFRRSTLVWIKIVRISDDVQNPNEFVWLSDENLRLKSKQWFKPNYFCSVQTEQLNEQNGPNIRNPNI